MSAANRKHYRHLPAFILLVLTQEPAHGGAIKTLLEAWLPGFVADSAALYRALQQLEKEGSVISEWDTTPPGPARRVYEITAQGWDALEQWRKDIEGRLEILTFFLKYHDRVREGGPRTAPASPPND